MTAMSGAGKGGGRGLCDGGDRFAMEDHFHKADPPETMPDQEGVPVLLTVTGKQTDPDGNTQENTSVYLAVCRNKEDGFFLISFYPAAAPGCREGRSEAPGWSLTLLRLRPGAAMRLLTALSLWRYARKASP